jgi:transmembrane sensor
MRAAAMRDDAVAALAADPVERDAARWFARLANAGPDHPERGRFEAWLMASPRHAREYARFDALWRDFDSGEGLRRLAGGVSLQAEAQGQARAAGRRRVLGQGALGLVVLCVTGFTAWRTLPRDTAPLFSLQRRSARGQTLEQVLPDGSLVLLAPDTALDLVFHDDRRGATLTQGEAFFDVAHDAERPFTVQAGRARVRVLGTRFVVSYVDDAVRVSVLSGRVHFEADSREGRTGSASDGAKGLVLVAGEVAQWRAGELSGSPQRLRGNAADALAWRSGSLVFSGDTLAVVAEQLGRYAGITLETGELHDSPIRITAVVQLRDAHAFVRSLPQLAPLTVEAGGGATSIYRLHAR